MGQTESHEYKPVETKKEPPVPTFLEINRQRVAKLQSEHNVAIEAMITAELTEEKLAESVTAVANWIVEKINSAPSTDFEGTANITLFAETWKKISDSMVEGITYELSFNN